MTNSVSNTDSNAQIPVKEDFLAISYNADDLPIYFVRRLLSNVSEAAITPHWNEDMQIVSIISGKMICNVNGSPSVLHEGEVCIINAGAIHYFESIPDSDCEYYCFLANEMIFSNSSTLRERFVIPMFHSFHPNIAILNETCKNHAKLIALCDDLYSLLSEKPIAYELLIAARAHEFLAYVFESLGSSFFLPISQDEEGAEEFCKMLAFIHSEYPNKILVDDIAAVANISRKYCYALFHKFSKMTPGDYLTDHRLTTSRNLLKQVNIPINVVAEKCGFSHQSHFTNLFNKKYGITPKKYRKSCVKPLD